MSMTKGILAGLLAVLWLLADPAISADKAPAPAKKPAATAAVATPVAAPPQCTTGDTSCAIDTVDNAKLVAAMTSPDVGNRVSMLWIQQCQVFIYPETGVTGHKYRNDACLSIAANRIPASTLVAQIMNLTVQAQILSTTCTLPTDSSLGGHALAGCMVDADVNAAITAAMTVNNQNAMAKATQPTVNSNSFTVDSATGIVPGQTINCPGVPSAAVVTFVSGTTVVFNTVTTAPLSSTQCSFDLFTGFPTRAWG